jgi:hypothetical protein
VAIHIIVRQCHWLVSGISCPILSDFLLWSPPGFLRDGREDDGSFDRPRCILVLLCTSYRAMPLSRSVYLQTKTLVDWRTAGLAAINQGGRRRKNADSICNFGASTRSNGHVLELTMAPEVGSAPKLRLHNSTRIFQTQSRRRGVQARWETALISRHRCSMCGCAYICTHTHVSAIIVL